MSDPYIGEIRMFGGNFAPVGWAFCNGQTLPISENDALFTLIGTTYGGDGQETFNLPDLQGRIPLHMGTGSSGTTYQIGEKAGVETVTLTTGQIPAHTHPMLGSTNAATTLDPTNNVLSTAPLATTFPYGTDAPLTPLAANAVTPVGGSQPHENLQPFLCISFIISLYGIFPTQN
jgi:microcystin-dependent protein